MIARFVRNGTSLARQANRLFDIQSTFKCNVLSSILVQKQHMSTTRCLLNSARTDVDLHKFLVEEIKSEKEISHMPKNGRKIPGFEIKENGADVILSRKFQNEQITIRFNVNSSVDDGAQEFSETAQERPEDVAASMKSKPDFVVEVRKTKDLAMVFNCGFLGDAEEAEQTEKSDLFEIQNFYLLEKGLTINSELNDSIYLGDGALIDGQFYDLLMDYLDERGIGSEFAENLVDYATYYEHEQYISLLDRIKEFISNQ